MVPRIYSALTKWWLVKGERVEGLNRKWIRWKIFKVCLLATVLRDMANSWAKKPIFIQCIHLAASVFRLMFKEKPEISNCKITPTIPIQSTNTPLQRATPNWMNPRSNNGFFSLFTLESAIKLVVVKLMSAYSLESAIKLVVIKLLLGRVAVGKLESEKDNLMKQS